MLTEAQAIERGTHDAARAAFAAPASSSPAATPNPEFALGAWRMYFHQYRDRAGSKDRGGLSHTYIILDPVGNCLANIPGTDPGAPR